MIGLNWGGNSAQVFSMGECSFSQASKHPADSKLSLISKFKVFGNVSQIFNILLPLGGD